MFLTLKNMKEAGNPASCQVFQRYLSCCRSIAYLLSEASRRFHLTSSVLSSALLWRGVDGHGADTDSIINTQRYQASRPARGNEDILWTEKCCCLSFTNDSAEIKK